jgi:hypothetical protein
MKTGRSRTCRCMRFGPAMRQTQYSRRFGSMYFTSFVIV